MTNGIPAEPLRRASEMDLAQVKAWLADPTAYEAASQAAARTFSKIFAANEQQWRELLTQNFGSIGEVQRAVVQTGAPSSQS